MLNFKSFITEATGSTSLTTLPGVPENLHNFMFHLSGPSDPHGATLNEAAEFYDQLEEEERKRDVINVGGAQPKFNPDDAAHPSMNLPKTRSMIRHVKTFLLAMFTSVLVKAFNRLLSQWQQKLQKNQEQSLKNHMQH